MSQLGQFWPKTEADLLRQYLDKDHQHRHALRVLPRRALIDQCSPSGNATAQGYKGACALFGNANLVDGGSMCLAHDNEYMLFSMHSNGMSDRLGEYYTPDFAGIAPEYLIRTSAAAVSATGIIPTTCCARSSRPRRAWWRTTARPSTSTCTRSPWARASAT